MLTILLYTAILHLTLVCNKLISFYFLIDNKNNLINTYNIYNDYTHLQLLIKTTIKMVLYKELLFRIYCVELIKTFFNNDEMNFLWIIIYSSFNIYYHTYSNNIITISNFIKTLIISNYLINVSIISSVIIHLYSEFFGIIFDKYILGLFTDKPNITIVKNTDTININKFKNLLNSNMELANKDDVEQLLSTLSNKKLN